MQSITVESRPATSVWQPVARTMPTGWSLCRSLRRRDEHTGESRLYSLMKTWGVCLMLQCGHLLSSPASFFPLRSTVCCSSFCPLPSFLPSLPSCLFLLFPTSLVPSFLSLLHIFLHSPSFSIPTSLLSFFSSLPSLYLLLPYFLYITLFPALALSSFSLLLLNTLHLPLPASFLIPSSLVPL